MVAEIDIGALRAARQERLLHNPLAHLRQSLYRAGADRGYPPATFAGAKSSEGNRTVEKNETVIRKVIRENYAEHP